MSIHRPTAAAAVAAAIALAGAAVPAGAAPAGAAQAGAASQFRARFAPPPARTIRHTALGRSATAARRLSRSGGATFRTIDVPGAYGTMVTGVTDNGIAGGSYFTDEGAKSHGFIEQGDQLVKFDYPGTSGVTSLDG